MTMDRGFVNRTETKCPISSVRSIVFPIVCLFLSGGMCQTQSNSRDWQIKLRLLRSFPSRQKRTVFSSVYVLSLSSWWTVLLEGNRSELRCDECFTPSPFYVFYFPWNKPEIRILSAFSRSNAVDSFARLEGHTLLQSRGRYGTKKKLLDDSLFLIDTMQGRRETGDRGGFCMRESRRDFQRS